MSKYFTGKDLAKGPYKTVITTFTINKGITFIASMKESTGDIFYHSYGGRFSQPPKSPLNRKLKMVIGYTFTEKYFLKRTFQEQQSQEQQEFEAKIRKKVRDQLNRQIDAEIGNLFFWKPSRLNKIRRKF